MTRWKVDKFLVFASLRPHSYPLLCIHTIHAVEEECVSSALSLTLAPYALRPVSFLVSLTAFKSATHIIITIDIIFILMLLFVQLFFMRWPTLSLPSSWCRGGVLLPTAVMPSCDGLLACDVDYIFPNLGTLIHILFFSHTVMARGLHRLWARDCCRQQQSPGQIDPIYWDYAGYVKLHLETSFVSSSVQGPWQALSEIRCETDTCREQPVVEDGRTFLWRIWWGQSAKPAG